MVIRILLPKSKTLFTLFTLFLLCFLFSMIVNYNYYSAHNVKQSDDNFNINIFNDTESLIYQDISNDITDNNADLRALDSASKKDILVENLTTSGWSWRKSNNLAQILNKSLDKPLLISVKSQPNYDYVFTALVIYYNTVNISGTVYANFTFCIYNVSYFNPNVSSDTINPDIELLSWFNITEDPAIYPRITHADLSWIEPDNISVVYSFEHREIDPGTGILTNYFKIRMFYFDVSSRTWSDYIQLTAGTGYVKSIDIAVNDTTGYSKYVTCFVIQIEISTFGNKIIIKYYGHYEIYNMFDPLDDLWIWEFEKTGIDGMASKPVIYGSKIYSIVAIKYGEGDSEIHLVALDVSSGSLSGPGPKSLITTETFAEQWGVYADFKDPTASAFYYNTSQVYLLVSWIAYTAVEEYLSLCYTDLSGNDVSDIMLISEASSPIKPELVHLYSYNNTVLLLWVDSGQGTQEVSYIRGIWNSTNSTWTWKDKSYVTSTGTNTLFYDYSCTIHNDVIVPHISYGAEGNREILFNMGYNDSDRDGLGNWEEENVYSTDSFNSDSDS